MVLVQTPSGRQTTPVATPPAATARALKAPVPASAVAHRDLLDGPFWQRVPAYAAVTEAAFLDHRWQAKNSITDISKLLATVKGLVSDDFLRDAEAGFRGAPMAVRVSPYVMALINWANAQQDPLRTQFIPVASRRLPDHPMLDMDSLHERGDMPVQGLVHRYADKALFLALGSCPVYCRFCTRSYAVGRDTAEVAKFRLGVNNGRWDEGFAYIASRPELEDIVVSGGDVYQLRPEQITLIGERLLAIPHVLRFRYASRGPAVMPQKILTDDAWLDALTAVVEKGRRMHKDVVLHTHFNHPSEITAITKRATDRLMERGITVRNQSVLQRHVNDSTEVMTLLGRRLSYVNVHPYYVYVHDLVKGVEDLRTTVGTALHIEKHVRGATAGLNTPTFVVDAPGGGGKRDVHSYEHYDRVTGVSVYAAPSVHPGRYYCYFDPIDQLPPEGQRQWADRSRHQAMIDDALAAAKANAAGAGRHRE